MKYQVITQVPSEYDARAMEGNLAACAGIWQTDDPGVKRIDPVISFLTLRVPVFRVGELLIVNDDGREMTGAQRKADKWDVVYDTYDNVEEALMRALEVLDS